MKRDCLVGKQCWARTLARDHGSPGLVQALAHDHSSQSFVCPLKIDHCLQGFGLFHFLKLHHLPDH